jgi:hypothetical protein
LPRALLLSLTITTVIYVLVALSAVVAVGWRELSASGAPLVLVARRALGEQADTLLALMALAADGRRRAGQLRPRQHQPVVARARAAEARTPPVDGRPGRPGERC